MKRFFSLLCGFLAIFSPIRAGIEEYQALFAAKGSSVVPAEFGVLLQNDGQKDLNNLVVVEYLLNIAQGSNIPYSDLLVSNFNSKKQSLLDLIKSDVASLPDATSSAAALSSLDDESTVLKQLGLSSGQALEFLLKNVVLVDLVFSTFIQDRAHVYDLVIDTSLVDKVAIIRRDSDYHSFITILKMDSGYSDADIVNFIKSAMQASAPVMPAPAKSAPVAPAPAPAAPAPTVSAPAAPVESSPAVSQPEAPAPAAPAPTASPAASPAAPQSASEPAVPAAVSMSDAQNIINYLKADGYIVSDEQASQIQKNADLSSITRMIKMNMPAGAVAHKLFSSNIVSTSINLPAKTGGAKQSSSPKLPAIPAAKAPASPEPTASPAASSAVSQPASGATVGPNLAILIKEEVVKGPDDLSSEVSDDALEKYVKMRTIGVPAQGINQKMSIDGMLKSSKAPAKSAPAASAASAATATPAAGGAGAPISDNAQELLNYVGSNLTPEERAVLATKSDDELSRFMLGIRAKGLLNVSSEQAAKNLRKNNFLAATSMPATSASGAPISAAGIQAAKEAAVKADDANAAFKQLVAARKDLYDKLTLEEIKKLTQLPEGHRSLARIGLKLNQEKGEYNTAQIVADLKKILATSVSSASEGSAPTPVSASRPVAASRPAAGSPRAATPPNLNLLSARLQSKFVGTNGAEGSDDEAEAESDAAQRAETAIKQQLEKIEEFKTYMSSPFKGHNQKELPAALNEAQQEELNSKIVDGGYEAVKEYINKMTLRTPRSDIKRKMITDKFISPDTEARPVTQVRSAPAVRAPGQKTTVDWSRSSVPALPSADVIPSGSPVTEDGSSVDARSVNSDASSVGSSVVTPSAKQPARRDVLAQVKASSGDDSDSDSDDDDW